MPQPVFYQNLAVRTPAKSVYLLMFVYVWVAESNCSCMCESSHCTGCKVCKNRLLVFLKIHLAVIVEQVLAPLL